MVAVTLASLSPPLHEKLPIQTRADPIQETPFTNLLAKGAAWQMCKCVISDPGERSEHPIA